VDYLNKIGMDTIKAYEDELLGYATKRLSEAHGLELIGTAAEKTAVLSFLCLDVHPHDVGTILDYEGIAIRAGHHCTQPLMQRLGITATARISLSFYNTIEEIDVFASAIPKVFEVFV